MGVQDFESLPYAVWGKIKRNIKGWNVSGRGEIRSQDLDSMDLDVQVEGDSTNVQFLGKAGV